jgi:hypothetical protein
MKRIRILLTILIFTTAPRLALCSVDENQIVSRINFFFSVYIHLQDAWAQQPDKENLDDETKFSKKLKFRETADSSEIVRRATHSWPDALNESIQPE